MNRLLCLTRVALAACALGALPAQAQTPFDDALRQARDDAHSDRNREAASHFADAMRADPARRREVLQEYADQLLYSGRAGEALGIYREVLAAPRSDDERYRAEKGMGLALLWTDRPSEAVPVFRKLVAEHPDDQDASRNLGRALSWSGRQRLAAAHLKGLLREHPDDGEARVQLAQAQAWMGRNDEALRSLDGATARRDDGTRLRAQLERDTAPRTSADFQRATQSDGLVIRDARVGQSLDFQRGRGTVGLQLERFAYDRQASGDSATVTRPQVVGRYRFTDAWELHAQAGQDRIRLADGTRHDPGVYASWLTWWPNDLLRFDASINRETFDNLKSLRSGLTVRQQGLSVDVTPDERWRATARAQHGDYSDGNRRSWGQFETEYRAFQRPDTWLGLRYTQFSFAKQLNGGYFNPRTFRSEQLTLRTLWHPAGDDGPWEVAGAVAWGREHADPDGDKSAYDASLRTSYRIDDRTRIEARAQRFSSRASSPSGFARTILGIGLERSW